MWAPILQRKRWHNEEKHQDFSVDPNLRSESLLLFADGTSDGVLITLAVRGRLKLDVLPEREWPKREGDGASWPPLNFLNSSVTFSGLKAEVGLPSALRPSSFSLFSPLASLAGHKLPRIILLTPDFQDVWSTISLGRISKASGRRYHGYTT